MADFERAFRWVILRHEDDPRSPGRVGIDNDGGRVRYGLNERSNPGLTPLGFYAMPAAGALVLAKKAYLQQYWGPAHLNLVKDDRVAMKVFDLVVNEYIDHAVRILQHAVLATYPLADCSLSVDGHLGPATAAAISACDPQELIAAISDRAWTFHQALNRIDKVKYPDRLLKGWRIRDFDQPPADF